MAARAHRRLHRFLLLDFSRDERRLDVSPDNPLLPNYKYVPIGYHGRASSSSFRERKSRARKVKIARCRSAAAVYSRAKISITKWKSAFSSANRKRMGETISIERRGRTYFRFVSRQRLVGARHSGLGISAARTVSGEKFCDFDFAVRRHDGSARAVSHEAFERDEGDPQPLDYLSTKQTKKTAASTSISKFTCKPKKCAMKTPSRFCFRARIRKICTGQSGKC
jgi:hypothetical protein